jgi:hypothetical protein
VHAYDGPFSLVNGESLLAVPKNSAGNFSEFIVVTTNNTNILAAHISSPSSSKVSSWTSYLKWQADTNSNCGHISDVKVTGDFIAYACSTVINGTVGFIEVLECDGVVPHTTTCSILRSKRLLRPADILLSPEQVEFSSLDFSKDGTNGS